MKFFDKIFKRSNIIKAEKTNPDNTRLLQLLENYVNDNKHGNYKKVVAELTEGNAFLVVPSEHDGDEKFHTWTPSSEGYTINIGIYFVDGLKATAAFTSKEALFAWKKEETKCVSLPSKAFLKICEESEIDRIVIDNKLRTMVVLQRNNE